MKPILFNTAVVKTLLDGRKTVTRRLVKPLISHAHGIYDIEDGVCHFSCGSHSNGMFLDWSEPRKIPYAVGDVLYVRETFNSDWCDHTIYKADGGSAKDAGYKSEPKWHPSLHMPKSAARIFLKVTGVRVERLMEIDSTSAFQEGCSRCIGLSACGGGCDQCESSNPIAWFKNLWNSTIKKQDLDEYGWDANPFVWVIEFERCEKPEVVL